MGSGKSTLAQELVRRWGLRYISSDVTRKRLARIPALERRYEPYGKGIYSMDFSRQTYSEMLNQARQALGKGKSVVLDASFRTALTRREALEAAHRMGVEAWVIECTASGPELRRRLERREIQEASVSDGRWDLRERQEAEWEPVQEVPKCRYIALDTTGSLEATRRQLLRELYIRWVQSSGHLAGGKV
jgi:predicted kinase